MAKREDRMDAVWDEVAREVSSRQFLVFPGSVSLQAVRALWPTDQPIGPFLDLAAQLGVRMVYLRSDVLTPEQVLDAIAVSLAEVSDALDAPSPEEFVRLAGIAQEPAARELIAFSKEHYGRRASVHAEWVHEGVVHAYSAYSDWHSALFDKAGEVADLLDYGTDDE
jgi:hypothetical protein